VVWVHQDAWIHCPVADALHSLNNLIDREMTEEHPNVSLIKRLDPSDLAGAKDLFAENVVFHYFNPNMPELQGDYVGLDGIRTFFEMIGERTGGTFKVNPVSITAAGDELVVVRSRNTLTIGDRDIALDVVVVWRVLDGRIVEVWDIVPTQPSEVRDD
jgi:ketosteroid isomerase-like protein